MTLCFQNSGEIDPRMFELSGVNVKDSSDAFGHFGTGLKYALAVLAREQQSCSIWIGEIEYKVGVEKELIRGKEFSRVRCGPILLPFTTELGKNWELWQALRELYCNCMDEGGEYGQGLQPGAGQTTVTVSGARVEAAWTARASWLIEPQDRPLLETAEIRIYQSRGAPIFYQGIKVSEPNKGLAFTYDGKKGLSVALTEDRTLRFGIGSITRAAFRAVARCKDRELIQTFCNRHLEKASWESSMAVTQHILDPSSEFLAFMERIARKMGSRSPAWVKQYVSGSHPELFEPQRAELGRVQQYQLARAVEFLNWAGYTISESEVFVTGSMPESLLGSVEDGQIYISTKAFQMGGTKLVASTIFEEWLHKTKEVRDESREMQEWLLNELFSRLEELKGEAL